MIKDDII